MKEKWKVKESVHCGQGVGLVSKADIIRVEFDIRCLCSRASHHFFSSYHMNQQ